MIERKLRIVPFAAAFRGAAADAVSFTLQRQLLSEELWRSFVRVYESDSDDVDLGWRGEYFGKMMRGACLVYQYRPDEKLYAVLENAVRGLLEAQRPDGRISTYSAEKQLNGWDVWCRKYVITGLLHFVRICKSEPLKAQILFALRRHADALLENVGDGEEQVPITHTSEWWGGVNSSSILEPMLDLYSVTGEKRYLSFAEHILSHGGCRDGDLIALAERGEKLPFEYPETKAYETMSFFEGVLAYYEFTGKERYFNAVRAFIDAVAESDLTVIGCCGCTHELFDHSSLVQTEPRQGIMQETCVTVTWMRLLLRFYQHTAEARYYDLFERSARNALYGSLNTHWQQGINGNGRPFSPLAFDSYSPLRFSRRGKGIGGLKHFSFGGFYGCCACIASAGIGLVPLSAVQRSSDGFVFSTYESGELRCDPVSFRVRTDYPRSPNVEVRLRLPSPARFVLRLRVPEHAENVRLYLNGAALDVCEENGFLSVGREWQKNDVLTLSGAFSPVFERLNGRTAVLYGPTVLARDADKEGTDADLEAPAALTGTYRCVPPEDGETLRLLFERTNGESPLLLTDYASCGKRWETGGLMSVWLDLQTDNSD